MYFNIKHLYIRNFRSIQEGELDIKDGLYSIEGLNLDTPQQTNGAGKSSIINAIFWCLTGNDIDGALSADEVINIIKGKNCKVECIIDTDQGEVVISRVRKDEKLGNNLHLSINGQDLTCHKIADTQDRINQLIKIPFDLFKSVMMITSDMKSAFSKLNPQGRVAVLESIRDYSIWEKVRNEANLDIKKYLSEIRQNQSRIDVISGSIQTYTKLLNDDTASLELIKNSNQIQMDYDQLEIIKKDISTLTNDLSDIVISDEYSDNNRLIEYQKTKEELQKSIQKIIDNGNNSINQCKININNINNDIKNLEREINDINDWFVKDKCSMCGKQLDRTEEDISIKHKRLDELHKNLELQMALLHNNNNTIRVLTNNDNTKTDKNKLKDIEDKIVEYHEEIANKNKERQLNLAKKSDIEVKLGQNRSSLSIIEGKIREYDTKIKTYEENILKYTADIERLTVEKKEIELLNNNLISKQELSEFYYKLTGPKGNLRPLLLAKDISYLNKCIEKYINVFFNNTSVSLSIPTIEDNSINIIINDNDVVKPISSLSGGEKKRVNLAIQLGIYDLIRSTTMFDCNLWCIDEIESELDPLGIEQLLEIIEEKSENIPTVLWITNHPTVKESVGDKILVKKAMNVTTIGYK